MDNLVCGSSILVSIEQQSIISANKTAIEFYGQSISHFQLQTKSDELADKFIEAGITANTHIGVFMDRTPEVLVCLLALWKIEAVYIPLDIEFPTERLRYIVEDAVLERIITQKHLAETISRLAVRQLIVDNINFQNSKQNQSPFVIKHDGSGSSAYILYTSGSTGKPKGVKIKHSSLCMLFKHIIALLTLKSKDIFLGLASFSFDISLFELLVPLMVGGKLVLLNNHDSKDPQKISEAIVHHRVSVLQATPSLWHLVNHYSWNTNNPAIKAISTGEALPVKTARDIFRKTNSLWNLYGPTECTIWATAKKVECVTDLKQRSGWISIGSALPGYRTFVLDENGNEVNATKGELLIAGEGLAECYHAQPELTKEKFIYVTIDTVGAIRVYKTGDICVKGTDGELTFLGRIDNQLKLNGYRIELEEIEQCLEQHNSIKQATLKVLKTANQIDLLIAYIEYDRGKPNKSAEKINAYLSHKLPAYMLPQHYMFIDRIPLTINGKKNRNALPAPALVSKVGKLTAGSSKQEQNIASIICEILDINDIGIYDSFFDAGGNSMLSATLVLAINNRFSTHISLREMLLTPPTVSSISQLIKQHGLL